MSEIFAGVLLITVPLSLDKKYLPQLSRAMTGR